MKFINNDSRVDKFRFIKNLHTTSRQLYICSEIVRQLNNRQLPKELLSKILFEWSKNEERVNNNYKNSKGKLTENGTPTTSLNYYLDLCESLGLITNINTFYTSTRFSYLLNHLIPHKSVFRQEITFNERLFYNFQLLTVDADGILLVLSLLANNDSKSQIDLQRQFKNMFNGRLIAKQEFASKIIKASISEKYRTINFIWKKPEKYSEHILIPRCEWLSSLGLLSIKKEKNYTIYSMTEKGKVFYKNIPSIMPDDSIKDITDYWLFNKIFSIFDQIFPEADRISYNMLEEDDKNEVLGNSLNNALNTVKASSPFHIPLFDSSLFICMELFLRRKIVINFSDIFEKLALGFNYGNKQFLMKEGGRINESYITTRIIG